MGECAYACSRVTLARDPIWSLNEDQSVLQNSATSEVIAHANRFALLEVAAHGVWFFRCFSVAARAAFDTRNDLCQRNWDAACPDGALSLGRECPRHRFGSEVGGGSAGFVRLRQVTEVGVSIRRAFVW